MKKFLLILSFLMLMHVSHSQTVKVTGKVIDENLNKCPGAKIIDLKTKQFVIADSAGIYHIDAFAGDTLQYYSIGYTKESRVILKSANHVNVLLMNKEVNDLGAIWSKRQWNKANKEVVKKYHQLESKAEYLGRWNY